MFKAKELINIRVMEAVLAKEQRLNDKKMLELSLRTKREHHQRLRWSKEWLLKMVVDTSVEEGTRRASINCWRSTGHHHRKVETEENYREYAEAKKNRLMV